jgi:hypothetical protein
MSKSKHSLIGLDRVVGMVLPAGRETVEADAVQDDVAFERDVWEIADDEALLFLIEYIPEAAVDRLRELSEHFRLDLNEESEQPYWLNYRSHCGMKQ